MNYTKPEVAVLGEAVRVIEQIPPTKTAPPLTDGPRVMSLNSAYDLDE